MEGIKIENQIKTIANEILKDYDSDRAIDKLDVFSQPNRDVIIDITNKLMRICYPGYFREKVYKIYNVENTLLTLMEDVTYNLNKQIAVALKYCDECKDFDMSKRTELAEEMSLEFLKRIPKIREYLATDLDAAFDGDPAATSRDEIIFAYPGLRAITIFRLAHELYLLKVPVLPRIMTEYAHSETGIDIHPGATIGKHFFIDHGTGIVVGETTVIGNNVKIYQGVTLGALSTSGGQKLSGVRRHPTIEDDVTIYSNASILGGDTIIGKGATIGGNTFITSSIEAGAKIYYQE